MLYLRFTTVNILAKPAACQYPKLYRVVLEVEGQISFLDQANVTYKT